jgi:DNA mismatch endonuclease (patch repair protein)
MMHKKVRRAPLNTAVSAQMQRMPRSSTGPEMLIRRELHSRGLRFRVNLRGLPGRPDIAFTAARIAVFVDGCFWHSCPSHGILPKNNRDWWQEKLARNVERDREKDSELEIMGWTVVHVWEHERPSAAADTIQQLWMSAHAGRRRAGLVTPRQPVTCEILGGVVNGTGGERDACAEVHRHHPVRGPAD